jgi:hypothetical protein
MKRVTQDGFVIVTDWNNVVGVGLDTVDAWKSRTWSRNLDVTDCIKAGERCIPAKVTVTFDPKAVR